MWPALPTPAHHLLSGPEPSAQDSWRPQGFFLHRLMLALGSEPLLLAEERRRGRIRALARITLRKSRWAWRYRKAVFLQWRFLYPRSFTSSDPPSIMCSRFPNPGRWGSRGAADGINGGVQGSDGLNTQDRWVSHVQRCQPVTQHPLHVVSEALLVSLRSTPSCRLWPTANLCGSWSLRPKPRSPRRSRSTRRKKRKRRQSPSLWVNVCLYGSAGEMRVLDDAWDPVGWKLTAPTHLQDEDLLRSTGLSKVCCCPFEVCLVSPKILEKQKITETWYWLIFM